MVIRKVRVVEVDVEKDRFVAAPSVQKRPDPFQDDVEWNGKAAGGREIRVTAIPLDAGVIGDIGPFEADALLRTAERLVLTRKVGDLITLPLEVVDERLAASNVGDAAGEEVSPRLHGVAVVRVRQTWCDPRAASPSRTGVTGLPSRLRAAHVRAEALEHDEHDVWSGTTPRICGGFSVLFRSGRQVTADTVFVDPVTGNVECVRPNVAVEEVRIVGT